MDSSDAAYKARLQAYKKKVINKYMPYVMIRCALYTDCRNEKIHIAFHVFATAYRHLDNFNEQKFIVKVLDTVIDDRGARLIRERPIRWNIYDVAEMVLLYLWASRKVLGEWEDWGSYDLCVN